MPRTNKQIQNDWKKSENKKKLTLLLKEYGKFKFISIIDYDGDMRYFKVSTKKIITEGIKAQELLNNKNGKEISKKEYEKETKI